MPEPLAVVGCHQRLSVQPTMRSFTPRFADEGVTDVGVGEMHPIGANETEAEQESGGQRRLVS